MTEQLVLHETTSFDEVVFKTFETQLEAFLAQIPEPAAVPTRDIKQAIKMGDVKEADATAKLEALGHFNSFLPPQLVLSVMFSKLSAYKQADRLEKLVTKIIDKMWAHGILGGIDLLAMLSLVDIIAEAAAGLSNADAIKYLNEVEKIKAARRAANEAAKKVSESKPPKTPQTPPKGT